MGILRGKAGCSSEVKHTYLGVRTARSDLVVTWHLGHDGTVSMIVTRKTGLIGSKGEEFRWSDTPP